MKRNDSIHQCLSLAAIKAYLNDEISEQEKSIYVEHFANCALCEEVRESFSTVNQMGVEEDITDLQAEVFSTINRRNLTSRRRFITRIAAGILLPVTGLATYFYWNDTANNRLFKEHFQSYNIPDVGDYRSGDGIKQYENISLPKDLKLAIEKYSAKQYKESIPHFETYRKITTQNTNANFYYAMANVEVGNLALAKSILEEVRANDENLLEDATWYLALLNLKAKNKKATKKLLDELDKSKFYSPKAGRLLKQL